MKKKRRKIIVACNYLICVNAIDLLLHYKDCVAFVEDSDGLRTGQAISRTTVVVIDHNTEVVFGHYLLHQPVGTVALKTIVCSIEGDIMGVSPTIADTLAFIVEAASVIIQHFNSREVICTYYRLWSWTLCMVIGHLAIITCSYNTVTLLPNFTILSWRF